jgi:CheY-like chemotaxis protein/anti-sigma regulatory factor (Ser/Thr protein kinase)
MSDQSRRALVIDDDAVNCSFLSRILSGENVSAVTCGTGADALRLSTEQHFDLVLLDLGLPDVNGLDILSQLRGRNGTKVVVITADGTPESMLRAVRDQAFHYIHKPFEPEQIQTVVRACFAAYDLPSIDVISAKPDWFELSVPCTREAADRIEQFMRHLKADLPDELRDSVTQAFRELLMNAVEWGGGLDPNRRVRISYLRTKRMLLYRIADPGPGFKPEQLSHAAFNNPPGDMFTHENVRREKGLRPGGLGIMMVRAIADELVYNEAHNEVVFIKYLD